MNLGLRTKASADVERGMSRSLEPVPKTYRSDMLEYEPGFFAQNRARVLPAVLFLVGTGVASLVAGTVTAPLQFDLGLWGLSFGLWWLLMGWVPLGALIHRWWRQHVYAHKLLEASGVRDEYTPRMDGEEWARDHNA